MMVKDGCIYWCNKFTTNCLPEYRIYTDDRKRPMEVRGPEVRKSESPEGRQNLEYRSQHSE